MAGDMNGSMKALLIEDDLRQTRLMAQALAHAPNAAFDVEVATRLGPAVDRLLQGDVDVVVLDLSLPDAYGLYAFIRIKEHARGLPIVVLADRSEELTAKEAVHRGAFGYLLKDGSNDGEPSYDERLVRMASEAVDRPRPA